MRRGILTLDLECERCAGTGRRAVTRYTTATAHHEAHAVRVVELCECVRAELLPPPSAAQRGER